jgi:hypothetical protein
MINKRIPLPDILSSDFELHFLAISRGVFDLDVDLVYHCRSARSYNCKR